MESMATTSPRWASPCGKGVSSRRTIRAGPERVCVVDEDFARYYWPHASALGQRLFEGGEASQRCRSIHRRRRRRRGETSRTDRPDGPRGGLLSLRLAHRRQPFCGRPHQPSTGIARAGAAKSRSANRPRTAGERPPVDGYPHRRQPGGATLAGIAGGHLFADRHAPDRRSAPMAS